MLDIARLEALVTKLTDENVKLNKELKDSNAAQKAEIDRVIAALGRGGAHGCGGHVPDPTASRAKNIANLKLSFRKSGKVKDFKESQELKVQEWIKRFDEEATQLKNMNGIDDALTLP